MSGDDEIEKEDAPADASSSQDAAAIDKDDVDPVQKFLTSEHYADQRDGKPRITGVGKVPVANYTEYLAQLFENGVGRQATPFSCKISSKKSACLGGNVDDGESVSSVSSLHLREFVL